MLILIGGLNKMRDLDSYEYIRGFNYFPSYGSSGFEQWMNFDAEKINIELGRGKKYFPKMNSIRIWLSWDAYMRDPKRFIENFDKELDIAEKYGLKAMVVLYNRWHIDYLDWGGIYVDHFYPNISWIFKVDQFTPYLESVVGTHVKDKRIFMWDLCNEPFSYNVHPSNFPEIEKAEFNWLKRTYEKCKELDVEAPLTIGVHSGYGIQRLKRVEPIEDVLAIHPYYMGKVENPPAEWFTDKKEYEEWLDDYIDFSREIGKPLIANECCWGTYNGLDDDKSRSEGIKYNLEQLNKRKIGWIAVGLHHSLQADEHRKEYGPYGNVGNLAFIEEDGSLRPYHDIINKYMD